LGFLVDVLRSHSYGFPHAHSRSISDAHPKRCRRAPWRTSHSLAIPEESQPPQKSLCFENMRGTSRSHVYSSRLRPRKFDNVFDVPPYAASCSIFRVNLHNLHQETNLLPALSQLTGKASEAPEKSKNRQKSHRINNEECHESPPGSAVLPHRLAQHQWTTFRIRMT
jgi:hypothetical protein